MPTGTLASTAALAAFTNGPTPTSELVPSAMPVAFKKSLRDNSVLWLIYFPPF
jgi:hypothetical protein